MKQENVFLFVSMGTVKGVWITNVVGCDKRWNQWIIKN